LWTSWVSIDTQTVHEPIETVWSLARRQHGVVARRQLLNLGLHPEAIKHRLRKGRLHRVRRGVYAVGRPNLTQRGHWMAAVLASGPNAFLSHRSAAALWGIRRARATLAGNQFIDVTVDARRRPRCDGVRLHRVRGIGDRDRTRRDGIPVTSPIKTLIDLALVLSPGELETAINEADRLELVDPERLRSAAEARAGQQGVGPLRAILDFRTFTLTDSELERSFLRVVRRAGLPAPLSQQRVNGFRVDFYWPEFRLIVETDGLRYHRTPAQQSRDRIRDQGHAARGFIVLRFSHAQVAFDRESVMSAIRAVMRRQRPNLWTA
jgi:very-short-patch-repair endonuclease/predicted transcriptional regulator of viral defense system